MRTGIFLFLGFAVSLVKVNSQSPDSVFFSALVEKYALSVENGDTTLAASLWAQSPEVTFIRPSGTDYGWNGVKEVVKMFHDHFSESNLEWSDLRTSVYDDVAWLQFFWTFSSIMKSEDGSGKIVSTPVKTKGRETQIWRKINDEWRLVHVHYSGMPAE